MDMLFSDTEIGKEINLKFRVVECESGCNRCVFNEFSCNNISCDGNTRLDGKNVIFEKID
jgi:hypothetical protein